MNIEYEFHEIADLFPMLNEDELQAQADDIKKNGLVHPILLFEDKILDGRNRYVACGMVNAMPRFDTFDGSFTNAVERVWSENIHRRDLTSSQRAAIAVSRDDVVDRIEEEARARQEATHLAGRSATGEHITKSSVVETFPAPTSARSRDVVAKTADTNPRYITDAKKIKRDAPDVFDMVKTGRLSIPDAKKIIELAPDTMDKVVEIIEETPKVQIKKAIYAAVALEPKPEPIPLPDGEFDVIIADPPWKYDFSKSDSRKIENQYPTMEVDDICDIGVPASDNAVLFLWATAPKLIEAMQVMHAWGFVYKTNAVWVKDKIGMGYYWRSQHEILLTGTRGKGMVPDPELRRSSVIRGDRTEHSRKPDVLYEMIETMYPNGKYLEMFARKQYNSSWTVFGNDVARL